MPIKCIGTYDSIALTHRIIYNGLSSVKKELNTSAKSIDSCHPAQSKQADAVSELFAFVHYRHTKSTLRSSRFGTKQILWTLTDEVRNKEINEQMHGRNIRFGRDSNQRPRTPKGNTITTELKRILSNAVARYCI